MIRLDVLDERDAHQEFLSDGHLCRSDFDVGLEVEREPPACHVWIVGMSAYVLLSFALFRNACFFLVLCVDIGGFISMDVVVECLPWSRSPLPPPPPPAPLLRLDCYPSVMSGEMLSGRNGGVYLDVCGL